MSGGPKVKIARALGTAFTQKAARVMEKRTSAPGQHGMARKRNASVYKTQLVEKQRLKHFYNISEAQLRKAYASATRVTGATGEALMQILETRLDAIVQRMGLARTQYAARQYVAHGHFEVNGRRSYSPSQQVKVGDVVSLREKSKNHAQIIEALANAQPAPEYLEVEKAKMSGKLLALPSRAQVPVPINEQLVVEYYSR